MSSETRSSNSDEILIVEDDKFEAFSDFRLGITTIAYTENYKEIVPRTTSEQICIDSEQVFSKFLNENNVQEIMLKGGRAKPSKTKKTVAKKTKKDVEEKEEIEEQEEQVEKAKIKREPVNSTTKKVRKTKSVKAEKEDR